MGSLTTFTVYNDGAHMLDPRKPENEKNIQQFASAVYDACLGVPRRTNDYSRAVGNFANMVEVQDTRHADDHTLYVHMGNCVTELNPYTERTKKLFRDHPDFASRLLKFLKEQAKELSKLQKEIEEGK